MLQGPSGPQTMFLLLALTVCTPEPSGVRPGPEVSLPVCTALYTVCTVLYTVCNALARLLSLSGIEAPGGSQAGAVPPLCPGEEAESRGKWPIHGRAGAQPHPPSPCRCSFFQPHSCFSSSGGSKHSPEHSLHLPAVSLSAPAPGSNNNLLRLYDEVSESFFPKCFQLYWL